MNVTQQKRFEAGLCTVCGKRKAYGGKQTCWLCAEKNRRALEKRRRKAGQLPYDMWVDKRKEWVENGRCFLCGAPAMKGQKLCEKHYKINIDSWTPERRAVASRNFRARINAETALHCGRKRLPIRQTFYKAVEKVQSGDMTIRQAAEYAGMKQTRFYNLYREYLEKHKGEENKGVRTC